MKDQKKNLEQLRANYVAQHNQAAVNITAAQQALEQCKGQAAACIGAIQAIDDLLRDLAKEVPKQPEATGIKPGQPGK